MNIKNLKNTRTYTRGRFKNKTFEIRGHWSQSEMASDAVMEKMMRQIKAANELNQQLMARMAELTASRTPELPAAAAQPENEDNQTPKPRRSPRRRSPRRKNPVAKAKDNELITPRRKRTASTPDSPSIERSNSLTLSLKSKKRQPKTPKEQTLRSRLGSELKLGDDPIDDKLLNGELHGSDGELNLELIEDLTDGIMTKHMKNVYGSDYSDEDLPNKAFAMVVDVIDKRWNYKADSDLKQSMRVRKRNHRRRKKGKGKRKRCRKKHKPNKSPPAPKVKKEIVFSADYTTKQARKVLNIISSDDEDGELIECCDKSHKLCRNTFPRSQGFPELARESGMMLRCRPCHDKSEAALKATERAQQKKREREKEQLLRKKQHAAEAEAKRKKDAADAKTKKKKAAAERAERLANKKAAKKAADKKAADKKAADKKAADKRAADKKAADKKRRAAAAKKVTDFDEWKFPLTGKKLAAYFKFAAVPLKSTGRPYIYAHRPGANVLGFWPGTARWYQAQVYGRHGHGQLKLYFPEDDSVYIGAPEEHVRKPDMKQLWAQVDRRHYSGLEFEHKEQEQNTPSELGLYKVAKIQSGTNKYMCVHKATGKQHSFQIGYIQRLLLTTLVEKKKRERKM